MRRGRARKVRKFKSISLVTSVYKIITKVPANILSKVLLVPSLIFEGAFIAGRQILDQDLIVNGTVEDFKEGVILKIDFKKAYSHVDWNFLDKML